MLEIPRFFRDSEHREHFANRLKLVGCPHCGCDGCLIRNGKLRGNDVQGPAHHRVERGQRFFCSNRIRRGGCGRSFCVLHCGVLPGFSINAEVLSAFLAAMLGRLRVHAAWQTLTASMSLSTAYRLWRRFGREQARLRPLLTRLCGPPPSDCAHPRRQSVSHLLLAFASHPVPVAAFQSHFQAPFFQPAPPL